MEKSGDKIGGQVKQGLNRVLGRGSRKHQWKWESWKEGSKYGVNSADYSSAKWNYIQVGILGVSGIYVPQWSHLRAGNAGIVTLHFLCQ